MTTARLYLWTRTHNLRLGRYSNYGMREVAASRDSTVRPLLTVGKYLSADYYRNLLLFALPQHSTWDRPHTRGLLFPHLFSQLPHPARLKLPFLYFTPADHRHFLTSLSFP